MGTVPQTVLEVAGREVVITHPDKVFFPQAGHTKLDLAKYYAAVADAALRRRVALTVRDVLDEHDLRGWPKTSGSRGMHVYVRIERRWSFDQVRRATLALAREVERRTPGQATSKWWKEERHGVFLDYNQNAKDRTVASAWSVRPTSDARVSMPLEWDEGAGCDPAAFTVVTAPARLTERGDASAAIDAAPGSLDKLLALSATQEAAGLGEAPWPPHYKKQRDEPPRVAPSRRKSA